MNKKWQLMVLLLGFFLLVSSIEVQPVLAGAPNVPNWFNINDNVTLSNSYISLCAASPGDPEGDDFQVRIEIFSAPIADIQSDWMWAGPGYAVCYHSPYGFPDGQYSWQARARDVNGEESGASVVMNFTLNAGQFEQTDYTILINRGYSVTLSVDDCVITNAESLVVLELQLEESTINNEQTSEDKAIEMIDYLRPVPTPGEVETFRNWLTGQVTGCSTVYYRIGNPNTGWTIMDSSGLGNIAYGYLTTKTNVPAWFQDVVAGVDQEARQVWGLLVGDTWEDCNYNYECMMTTLMEPILGDNPDDIKQRQLGVALANSTLSASNLIALANAYGLY